MRIYAAINFRPSDYYGSGVHERMQPQFASADQSRKNFPFPRQNFGARNRGSGRRFGVVIRGRRHGTVYQHRT